MEHASILFLAGTKLRCKMYTRKLPSIIFFIHTVLVMPRALAMDCTLGPENNMEETSANTSRGVYLDTSNPATCGGQLTDWGLCYYRLPRGQRTYQVELQMWRVNSDGSYALKDTSSQSVTTFNDQSSFNCRDFVLTENEYIQVERGDILGVYLSGRSEDNTALTVIGSGTDQDVLEYGLPSDTAALQLAQISGVRMHISANIGNFHTINVSMHSDLS